MENCGNCRFWMRNMIEKDGKAESAPDGSGMCRRYPPQPLATHWISEMPNIARPNQPPRTMYSVVNSGAFFPTMLEIGYCGEHQPDLSALH